MALSVLTRRGLLAGVAGAVLGGHVPPRHEGRWELFGADRLVVRSGRRAGKTLAAAAMWQYFREWDLRDWSALAERSR